MITAGKRVIDNTTYRFRVGETVAWSGSQTAPRTDGKLTEIVRLLPPLAGDLQYRIKSADEKHEFVAAERDLDAVTQTAKPMFAASPK